ncbi:formate/nitrite transporter family protein [Phaeacidiphilus oryzae]|uniref:formate/nitrite transporter family protein n=1 Tax=Phaeacidiphilus oryzae TaxID=348818 RepID=UPI000A07B200|nr:formate/nitrite transporter family protein [Phaeacidiphilus oryzae]
MPIPVPEALRAQGLAAEEKISSLRSPLRFTVNSMLAGAYVGVAVALMLAVTGPMQAAHAPYTKLVQGLVFGIALTLVIFAGSELSTGNMMTMVQGVSARRRGVGGGVAVIVGSFLGNLVGSIGFAALVYGAGMLEIGATPGHPAPAAALLAALIKTKTAESVGALFFRGVLCNFLVCLAVWMGVRTKSDGAKMMLIFWCLMAFVASGFEHVVANMTTFSLGMMAGVKGATLGAFAKNLLWVGLGNLVGGGLLVGVSYGFVGAGKPAEGETETATAGISLPEQPGEATATETATPTAVASAEPEAAPAD